MKTNQHFRQTRISILVSVSFMLILTSAGINAQKSTNFSGKWQYDKSKSVVDAIERDYDGTIILEISQDSSTISFAEVYIHPGRTDWKTASESYKLNGEEQIRKSSVGTNKNTVKWSPDRKVLTITNLDTQDSQDYKVVDSYSLSADGKILTIERYRKNPVTGETKAKKVYLKK
jgi:hypothetical protein